MRRHAFGPFVLDADLGLLTLDSVPTGLGQRGVALLRALLARAGEPIGKAELIEAAWPGLVVEESNLTVQIAAIRKVLETAGGADWIETLPRRGYRYVGPAVEVAVASGDPKSPHPGNDASVLPLPDKPSVAVLPFADFSGSSGRDPLSEGMVDDIIAGLARIKWLFVVARGSTDQYRTPAVDPKRVGRELGVRYVLQGSVRRAARRIRISCVLADAVTGQQVWAERYDRDVDDIFALQDDVSLAVVGAIEPSLRRAEAERVKRKRPDSLGAYELVLQAQSDVFSGMPEPSARALALLGRALTLEPDYALAHAYAAMCHHNRFLRAGLDPAEREASIHHARQAIANGQDDALALTFAGFSMGMDAHDRGAAITAFETALRASPSSALAYILGSVVLAWGGDAAKAIEWAERGLRLSPFDGWAFAAHHSVVLGSLRFGRFDQALAAAYKAVQANPAHSISYMLLAITLAKCGRMDEARAAAASVLRLQPGFRFGKQIEGVNCEAGLAAVLASGAVESGLPG